MFMISLSAAARNSCIFLKFSMQGGSLSDITIE